MNRSRKALIAGAAVLVVSAGGVGIAQAVGGDSEERVTGPDADKAAQAAVDAVGGGKVVGVEREDGGGTGWEVEVVRDGGRQVEVHLSPQLEQLGTERDDDGAGDRDEAGDND